MNHTMLLNQRLNTENFSQRQSIQMNNIFNKRILIVDDEVFNIEALKMIMESVFNFQDPSNFCDEALNGL